VASQKRKNAELRASYLRRALQKPKISKSSKAIKTVRRALANIIRQDGPEVKYPLPEWIFTLVHLLTIQPAIDIVLVDRQNRVLFVKRDDRWFSGFELVGGYGRTYFHSLAEWCDYLIMRDVGAHARLLGFAGLHLWKMGEHAHGIPLSIVAVCRLTSAPTKELDKIRFFKGVPKHMVPNHRSFVWVALRALKKGTLVREI
jgi:hypothetical protein